MMRSGTTLMMSLFDNTPSCLALPFEDGLLRGISHNQKEFNKAFQQKDFCHLRNCLSYTKYWVLEKRSDKELFSFKIPKEQAEGINFNFRNFDEDFKNRMNQLDQWNIYNFVDVFLLTVSEHINLLPNFEDTSHIFMKTPGSTPAIPLFLDAFKNASVIYIIRDPRASYASSKNYYNQNSNSKIEDIPLQYLIQWQNNVKLIHNLQKKYKERIKIVQYEKLVSNTEEVMKDVSEFLNLQYDDRLCKPTLFGCDWSGYSSHTNQQQGVDRKAIDRWKTSYNDLTRNVMCVFIDPNIRNIYGYHPEGKIVNNLASMKAVAKVILLRYLYSYLYVNFINVKAYFGNSIHKLLHQLKNKYLINL